MSTVLEHLQPSKMYSFDHEIRETAACGLCSLPAAECFYSDVLLVLPCCLGLTCELCLSYHELDDLCFLPGCQKQIGGFCFRSLAEAEEHRLEEELRNAALASKAAKEAADDENLQNLMKAALATMKPKKEEEKPEKKANKDVFSLPACRHSREERSSRKRPSHDHSGHPAKKRAFQPLHDLRSDRPTSSRSEPSTRFFSRPRTFFQDAERFNSRRSEALRRCY
ncbi:hypothetical protein L596_007644 [Steinernema carpocapsae]|uniref:Uncharacterized protein n=1 Tax=Steinernema carpocapsae TaxID=34508 RepID=A0A4U5PAJ8_STECR|nr:hypothetical protein L596_007644 [Steinernema carpocapsae]